MGKDHFRTDTECENCGHQVEKKFCTNCGQKNVETRQTFPTLVGHFAEDLTHYDTAFWKTLKHLLFRPGRLTRIYLEGKRQEYVPPVKLYIFISFIAFLIPGLLPNFTKEEHKETEHKVSIADQVNSNYKEATKDMTTDFAGHEISSLRELDSLRALPEGQNVGWMDYSNAKINLNFKENKITWGDVGKTFVHLLPKILFLYMPIFAFWLWIFHGKRRWYFFDHGIFTLHYFSFLLLSFTLLYIISWLFIQFDAGWVLSITIMAYLLYPFFYFFRSHRRMYGESRLVSRLKSFILFNINMISILFVLIAVGYYILLNPNH